MPHNQPDSAPKSAPQTTIRNGFQFYPCLMNSPPAIPQQTFTVQLNSGLTTGLRYTHPITGQTYTGPFQDVVGEGDVATIVLPDGTVQMFFLPAAKGGHSTLNKNGPWFIRSVNTQCLPTPPPAPPHQCPFCPHNSHLALPPPPSNQANQGPKFYMNQSTSNDFIPTREGSRQPTREGQCLQKPVCATGTVCDTPCQCAFECAGIRQTERSRTGDRRVSKCRCDSDVSIGRVKKRKSSEFPKQRRKRRMKEMKDVCLNTSDPTQYSCRSQCEKCRKVKKEKKKIATKDINTDTRQEQGMPNMMCRYLMPPPRSECASSCTSCCSMRSIQSEERQKKEVQIQYPGYSPPLSPTHEDSTWQKREGDLQQNTGYSVPISPTHEDSSGQIKEDNFKQNTGTSRPSPPTREDSPWNYKYLKNKLFARSTESVERQKKEGDLKQNTGYSQPSPAPREDSPGKLKNFKNKLFVRSTESMERQNTDYSRPYSNARQDPGWQKKEGDFKQNTDYSRQYPSARQEPTWQQKEGDFKQNTDYSGPYTSARQDPTWQQKEGDFKQNTDYSRPYSSARQDPTWQQKEGDFEQNTDYSRPFPATRQNPDWQQIEGDFKQNTDYSPTRDDSSWNFKNWKNKLLDRIGLGETITGSSDSRKSECGCSKLISKIICPCDKNDSNERPNARVCCRERRKRNTANNKP